MSSHCLVSGLSANLNHTNICTPPFLAGRHPEFDAKGSGAGGARASITDRMGDTAALSQQDRTYTEIKSGII